MNIVITSSQENVISIPIWLMKILGLEEGAQVKATVDGQVLRLTPTGKFLALEGVFREDEAFEQAMTFINEAWQSWTTLPSV